ncbi:MAG TPA: hypothetical protein VG929_09205 [Actinomycetota bacterium]|nr:hypothetical protein [Actinomycetota bacterium]
MSKSPNRRPMPVTRKGGAQRKSKKAQPKLWYQRVGLATWIVAGLAVVVVMFALLSRGDDVAEGPRALPVVGADLHSLVMDPTDPERLFIGSHQGVTASTDGGDTCEVVDSLDGADAMGWAFTDETILVGGHPGLYVSNDGGDKFEQRNEGLPNSDVHALGAGAGGIYGASPGAGLFASTDGGETWTVRNEDVGRGFMGKILVDPDDPDHVVAPDMQAGAVESRDGGKTWDPLGGGQGAMWATWDPTDTDDIFGAV